jgi:hypothetical protein
MTAIAITNTSHGSHRRREGRLPKPIAKIPATTGTKPSPISLPGEKIPARVRDVVLMVSAVLADAPFRVTDGGLKEQAAPLLGSPEVHASETVPLNPEMAFTDRLNVAL